MGKLQAVDELLKAEGITPAAPEKAPGDKPPVEFSRSAEDPAAPPDEQHPDDLPPGETPDDAEAHEAAGITWAELADKLGTDAADLYRRVLVPGIDGKLMPYGEFKDMAIKGKAAQDEIDTVRAEAAEQGRSLMIERLELNAAADNLRLTPEQKAHVERQRDLATERETQRLLAAMPGWKNPETAGKEFAKVAAFVGRYGLSQAELEYLVQDHRLVKLLRDVAMTQPLKAPQPKPAGRGNNLARHNAYEAAKRPGASKQDKLGAITALIN